MRFDNVYFHRKLKYFKGFPNVLKETKVINLLKCSAKRSTIFVVDVKFTITEHCLLINRLLNFLFDEKFQI